MGTYCSSFCSWLCGSSESHEASSFPILNCENDHAIRRECCEAKMTILAGQSVVIMKEAGNGSMH